MELPSGNKKFPSHKLRELNPKTLIPEEKSAGEVDDLAGVFITLGLIFNDMKSLILVRDEFFSGYSKPDGHINFHTGEWSGIDNLFLKTLIGTTYEFLDFLRRNRSIIESPGFLSFESQLSGPNFDTWVSLKAAAFDRADSHPFIRIVMRVRHNVAFHYSLQDLANGFRKHFYGNPENAGTEAAYYVIRKSDFLESRIFYSDAALAGYYTNFGISQADLVDKAVGFAHEVSRAILVLIDAYHHTKPSN
jgi:hypothetical protein